VSELSITPSQSLSIPLQISLAGNTVCVHPFVPPRQFVRPCAPGVFATCPVTAHGSPEPENPSSGTPSQSSSASLEASPVSWDPSASLPETSGCDVSFASPFATADSGESVLKSRGVSPVASLESAGTPVDS